MKFTTRDNLAYVSVLVFVLLTVLTAITPGAAKDVLIASLGLAGACMKDAYGYFLGSSKNAEHKE